MSIQTDEIYAVNLKTEHHGGDEMVNRMKVFERHLRRREFERFIYGPSQTPVVSVSKRESWVMRPAHLKSLAASLVDDLGRYIDLCLARFLVWRETRRKRKARKR